MSLEKASHELISAIANLLPGARGSLVGAELAGADLAGKDLSGEDISNADLSGANLAGANMSGAILRDTDLPGANLTGANLAGANLHGADLCGANLTGATGLDSVDFEYAFGDGATVWPTGFDVGDKVTILRPPLAENDDEDEDESLPRRISARMREEVRGLRDKLRRADDD